MSFGISRGYIHAVGYIPRNIAYIALAPNTPATELPVRPVHSRFWINFVPLEAMIASHPVLKIAVWYTISRTESSLTKATVLKANQAKHVSFPMSWSVLLQHLRAELVC